MKHLLLHDRSLLEPSLPFVFHLFHFQSIPIYKPLALRTSLLWLLLPTAILMNLFSVHSLSHQFLFAFVLQITPLGIVDKIPIWSKLCVKARCLLNNGTPVSTGLVIFRSYKDPRIRPKHKAHCEERETSLKNPVCGQWQFCWWEDWTILRVQKRVNAWQQLLATVYCTGQIAFVLVS